MFISDNIGQANYAYILSNHSMPVTVGEWYLIHVNEVRNYLYPEGESYIQDDLGRANYGILSFCQTILVQSDIIPIESPIAM